MMKCERSDKQRSKKQKTTTIKQKNKKWELIR